MKQGMFSIFKTVRRFAGLGLEDGQADGLRFAPPMTVLNASQLRRIAGGDEIDLPKGGWKTSPTDLS